jgi:hypothetical protein
MINDLKAVFSSKPLIIIFTLSLVLRFFLFSFWLPNSPSILGPDEGTYSMLAKFVSEGRTVQAFPVFGESLYNSSKSMIIISALFIKLGMSALDSVRLTSSIYGFASSIILAMFYVGFMKTREDFSLLQSHIFTKKICLLIGIYTFVPSNFAWSVVGLRESTSQFWLLLSFYLMLKLSISYESARWLYAILLLTSLTLAQGARPQTAILFLLIMFCASFVLLLKNKMLIPIAAVILAIFAGHKYTATEYIPSANTLHAFTIIKGSVDDITTLTGSEFEERTIIRKDLSKYCKYENSVDVFEGTYFICRNLNQELTEKSGALENIKDNFTLVQRLEAKRIANSANSQSALPVNLCQGNSEKIIVILKCNVRELPFRLFAFLFRPILIYDSGSSFLIFAALENLGWTALILICMVAAFRRNQNSLVFIVKYILIAYVLTFSSAAGLYEGNLGTAFRHKSSILWPLLIIVMITEFSKKKSLKTDLFPAK